MFVYRKQVFSEIFIGDQIRQIGRFADQAYQTRLLGDERLPSSENNLAVEFEVSRPTVRRALQNLEENGFISRRRGDGTRVLADKPTNSFNYATQPIADLLYGGGLTALSPPKAIIADEKLAHQLDGKPGKHWLKICQHRLDQQSSQMLVWGNVYIDFRYQDIQAKIDGYPGFICDLLEEQHGVVINEIQQVIKPISLQKNCQSHECRRRIASPRNDSSLSE